MPSWPIVLVLYAGREVMCGKKMKREWEEREWEEREWNRYSSERVQKRTSSLVGLSGALSHATN